MESQGLLTKVLLVGGSEDEYLLIHDMLQVVSLHKYDLKLAPNFEAALEVIDLSRFDVCILCHGAGEPDGLAFAGEIAHRGFDLPIIFLTDHGSQELDSGPMSSGAAIFLVKGQISPDLLERSIRYALKHQEARMALRESDQLFRQVITRSVAVKLMIDPASDCIVYANPAACKFYGYSMEELTRMRMSALSVLTNDEMAKESRRAIEGRRNSILSKHRLSSGTIRCVEMHSNPIDFRGRRLLYTIVHDVTNAKEAREALYRSDERFRASAESLSDALAVYSAVYDSSEQIIDFVVEYVNEAACSISGMEREKQIGRQLLDLFPSFEENGVFEGYRSVVESGEPLVRKFLIRDDLGGEDRHLRIFDVRAAKLHDGLIVIWREISDQKEKVETSHSDCQESKADGQGQTREVPTGVENLGEAAPISMTLPTGSWKDGKEIKDAVPNNVKTMAMDYMEEGKLLQPAHDQAVRNRLPESYMDRETCRFAKSLSNRMAMLTPAEIRVAALVRYGMKTKDIARLLSVSPKAVSFHRNNIRRKLNLTNKDVSLKSCLLSLQ